MITDEGGKVKREEMEGQECKFVLVTLQERLIRL